MLNLPVVTPHSPIRESATAREMAVCAPSFGSQSDIYQTSLSGNSVYCDDRLTKVHRIKYCFCFGSNLSCILHQRAVSLICVALLTCLLAAGFVHVRSGFICLQVFPSSLLPVNEQDRHCGPRQPCVCDGTDPLQPYNQGWCLWTGLSCLLSLVSHLGGFCRCF